MSTHASTITTTLGTSTSQTPTTASKRPIIPPSTTRLSSKEDEQQCLPIDASHIDRICSKTCRTRKSPFDKFEKINSVQIDMHFLPFCSSLLNRTIVKENLLKNTTESECRKKLQQITEADADARKATELFATYMQAIDCASPPNRYSIIPSNCQEAYRAWACSVKIPYFHQNHLIPPCRTICDEVERVCPTFRPSDRIPSFAGQPLFFCNGGIVPNSDYGRKPHCFDTCHLLHHTLHRSASSSSAASNQTSSWNPSLNKFVESIVTTPLCFEIEPLLPSSSEQTSSSIRFVDNSVSRNMTNTSLSASARTVTSSSCSTILLTFIFVWQMKFF